MFIFRYPFKTIIFFVCCFQILMGQGLIINHTGVQGFDRIPDSVLDQIFDSFKVTYGHTSHGSQIISGINYIKNNINSKWDFDLLSGGETGIGGEPGKLDFWARVGNMNDVADLGNPDYVAWVRETREHLLNEGNDRNIVMWSWCGQMSYNWTSGPSMKAYCDSMSKLEAEFPNVTFVYMTGHPDGKGNSAPLAIRNDSLRNFCTENNKVLYDFADIQQWDLEGNDYGNNENDSCDWCQTYCDECGSGCPDYEDCTNRPGDNAPGSSYTDCAHTHGLVCVLKGKTFWYMMARLTGWSDLSQNNPPIALNDVATTDEDNSVIIDVLSNDSGVDGNLDPSTVHVMKNPLHGTITNIDTNEGTISYLPVENFYGEDLFTYTVRDELGTTSNIAQVNITVRSVNDQPIALDDEVTTNINNSVVINVLANDSDVDGELDSSTVIVINNPSNGSIVNIDTGNGYITYVPNNGFSGNDSFTYSVADNNNLRSNPANVNITINENPSSPSGLFISK